MSNGALEKTTKGTEIKGLSKQRRLPHASGHWMREHKRI